MDGTEMYEKVRRETLEQIAVLQDIMTTFACTAKDLALGYEAIVRQRGEAAELCNAATKLATKCVRLGEKSELLIYGSVFQSERPDEEYGDVVYALRKIANRIASDIAGERGG